MNEIFAGSAALICSVLIWSLSKKKSSALLKNNYLKSKGWANQTEISLVNPVRLTRPEDSERIPAHSDSALNLPTNTRQRLKLLKELNQRMSEGPDARLEAITIAGVWGHPSVLKLLVKGLKDSDSRVVSASAAAIQNHRGKPHPKKVQASRPPRNVALMR